MRFKVTFRLEVEKQVTINEIENWANSIVKEFEEKENNSNSKIYITNIQQIRSIKYEA